MTANVAKLPSDINNLEGIKNALGAYAKDIKLNLSSVLREAPESGLSMKQIAGIALSSAYATKDANIIAGIEGEFAEGMTFSIPGFSAVSIDRLNALGGEALEDLNGSGHLYAAYMMVASLNNIARLIELKGRKVAAQAGRGAG